MSSTKMSSMYPEYLAGNCREGESDKERWNSFLGYIIYLVQVKVIRSVQSGGHLATPGMVMLRRGSPCVCVWHHGLLWKESVAAASRLCSPSATLWLHRPSTVWAGRFTQALTAWDTPVSTLIVSPFIHDERLHQTRCRGGKLFLALASVLQLYSLRLNVINHRDLNLLLPQCPVLYIKPLNSFCYWIYNRIKW